MPVAVDSPTSEQWAVVEANRGLVFMHVNRMRHLDDEEREDAVQDGMLGLLRAAQKFDPTAGWKFSTYASQWITAAIEKGRREALGRNYRRVRDAGEEWVPPAPFELVPERSYGDDVEAVVCCAVVVAAMRAACRDVLDHAIVDRIEAGDVMFSGSIAASFDVAKETVRLRTRRLAQFARPHLAA